MLHEVMHCVGLSHGARINNMATHPYNRTLPQVAYRAVLGASPYAGQILFLTGTNEIRPMLCGTVSAECALHADEGMSPEELSLPRNMPELHTEVAYENFMNSAEVEKPA